MTTLNHDRTNGTLASLASLASLVLAACNGQLAVVEDLDSQDSNLSGDGSNGGDVPGGSSNGTDPEGAPSSPPLVSVACTCATSPSLMALVCSGDEVPFLENDIVQTTADGNVAAFNVDDGFGGFQLVYWTAGSPAFSPGNGMMLGLSASGERVLAATETGMDLIDVNGGTTSLALGSIVGRGLLSASGGTIFGSVHEGSVAKLARADAGTGQIEPLGEIGPTIDRAYVTPDASTLVGYASTIDLSSPIFTNEYIEENPGSLWRQFRWNSQGLALDFLGAPEGSVFPEAVSADGSIIAGRNPTAYFRWSESAGYQEIVSSSAGAETRMSSDGAVVVGTLDPDGADEIAVFRWTEATGAVNITPGVSATVTDVSDDGNVVVATSWEPEADENLFPEATFVWDATDGTRTLDELLQDRAIDTTGWEFGQARALSADGKVLLGRATCDGVPTLYRITLSD